MKLKWLGHAAFLITSEEGVKIVTDPYEPGTFGIDYGRIEDTADIVVVSHEHPDHNYVKGVPGNPQVVRGTGRHPVKGIEFTGIASYHDESSGKERGPNNIFCFTVDSIRLCHLGDLGHQLNDKQIAAIGKVDVLLTPMAGNYTIDADVAQRIVDQVRPNVVVPMHYQTDRCPTFQVSSVEPFLAGKTNVKRLDTSEVEFKSDKLPSATEIVVLKHAL